MMGCMMVHKTEACIVDHTVDPYLEPYLDSDNLVDYHLIVSLVDMR